MQTPIAPGVERAASGCLGADGPVVTAWYAAGDSGNTARLKRAPHRSALTPTLKRREETVIEHSTSTRRCVQPHGGKDPRTSVVCEGPTRTQRTDAQRIAGLFQASCCEYRFSHTAVCRRCHCFFKLPTALALAVIGQREQFNRVRLTNTQGAHSPLPGGCNGSFEDKPVPPFENRIPLRRGRL